MNKFVRKVFGFLFVGIAVFGIGRVNAANYGVIENAHIDTGDVKISQDGLVSFDINVISTKGTVIPGDVNFDGVINLEDSKQLRQFVSGSLVIGGDPLVAFYEAADANRDGEVNLVLIDNDDNSSCNDPANVNKDDCIILNHALTGGVINETPINFGGTKINSQIKSVKYYVSKNSGLTYSEYKDDMIKSSDNGKISFSIGTEKVDSLVAYLIVESEGIKIAEEKVIDLSNFDWDTYLAELEASKNVTEETVKNPETVVAISVIGLAIIAIAGTLVAKKKNLFSRV